MAAALLQTTQPPLPAEYYDADYYDGLNGKSNYCGYTWERLGPLFRATAQWLGNLFPQAQSYLDVGCAKGYLVRALRESGKQACGIDHSRYCVQDDADSIAKPYLYEQRLEALALDRTFDIILAYETLEHLTETQIVSILPRLRQHVRLGLLATIPTPDMPHKKAWHEAQREPSHLTLKPRAWWVEQFVAAGWVYTPFHRLAERFCMGHPLPNTVGWNVFVFGV